jgi:hypothetical protein
LETFLERFQLRCRPKLHDETGPPARRRAALHAWHNLS